MRKGNRDAFDDIGYGGSFRAVSLHEFEAGRRRIKKVTHLRYRSAIER